MNTGEFYADLDQATGLWCVFHTDQESGKAFSSHSSKEEAELRAYQRNENNKIKPAYLKGRWS